MTSLALVLLTSITAQICDSVYQGTAAEIALGANGAFYSWSGRPAADKKTAWAHTKLDRSDDRHLATLSAASSSSLSILQSRDDPNVNPTPIQNATAHFFISCGGHRANVCSLCTVQDEAGVPTFDHGEDWCHGDCYWGEDDQCHLKTQQHWDGIIPLPPPSNTSANSTSPIPEMFSTNYTQDEKEEIHMAADRAIQEANFEAKMNYAEVKKEEEENTKSKKFWFIVIITASATLVCCAIPAVVLLAGYVCFPSMFAKKTAGEDSDVFEDGAGDVDESIDGYAA